MKKNKHGWQNWGDAYWHYRMKGMDQSDAAYRADQWEARQNLSNKRPRNDDAN